jgi:hypothetical protein
MVRGCLVRGPNRRVIALGNGLDPNLAFTGERSARETQSWKGYIKLALVSCPIALYTASSSNERVAFRQEDRRLTRIQTPPLWIPGQTFCRE